ncbi:MAG TPA: S28 family serine protease [Kofleriaceae bacterium]|nr:S28 family serine protease [Kofleriaceae bacterium]
MRAQLLAVVIALAAACGGGDDDGAAVDATAGDILEQLRALPEVASVTEQPTEHAGYRYFELQFDQPVDHENLAGPHFQQFATLIHKDVAAPMVLLHTGYGNWYYDFPGELTRLLGANQIVVEHRFFRGSRPTGTDAWQHLTIAQSAADHHRISDALHRIYGGKWLETGASKGGMTSIYHRRFYPDDVDGTVAYVAPESFGAPDYRYEPHVEALGPAPCRQALRDLQVELLTNRRAMLQTRAMSEATQRGYTYTRVTLPVAVESAVVSLEWAFWQYVGADRCPNVPAVTAPDATLWSFVVAVSPVSSSSDDDVAEFEAYYYQAEVQLGYPGTMDEHLTGLTMYGPSDFAGSYPAGVTRPPWTVDAMNDVDGWVKGMGDGIIFLYGEWDPWSGGMFQLGNATDSLRVVAPMAPHGAGIGDLTSGDQAAVLAKLEAWSGVTPDLAQLKRRARLQEPTKRVPPVIQLRP